MPDILESLELKDFDELVDETFVFSLEGVEQETKGVLIKAECLPPSFSGASRDPFVLEFQFPAEANIGQRTFQVETAKADRLPPMFLVPRGGDEDGWYMDSTFN